MTEMLNELRILLPGAQLLNGFLIALPFTSGFRQIVQLEKWIFMATFLCSLSSLILFTAPAVQHRLLRPLEDRMHFKDVASKQMLAGAFFLSVPGSMCEFGDCGSHWSPGRSGCGRGLCLNDPGPVVAVSVVLEKAEIDSSSFVVETASAV
ncbi:DUF6328 family protein [Massilia phosphatilytica]